MFSYWIGSTYNIFACLLKLQQHLEKKKGILIFLKFAIYRRNSKKVK